MSTLNLAVTATNEFSDWNMPDWTTPQANTAPESSSDDENVRLMMLVRGGDMKAFERLVELNQRAVIGTVARLSPDRPFDGKRFDVVVDIDPNQADLRPDMTASVEIQIAQRADALLVPVNAIFDRDGLHVVHVVGTRTTETRRIDLGESNDVYVEVLGGLREGERVSLSDVAPDGSSPRPASARELNYPAAVARVADAPHP